MQLKATVSKISPEKMTRKAGDKEICPCLMLMYSAAKIFLYSLLKLKPKNKTPEDNLLKKQTKKTPTVLQIPKADY